MSPLLAILIALFVAGAVIAVYALLAPRRAAKAVSPAEPAAPRSVDVGWTQAAGGEFDGLGESARCDMVFAVAALDDERSRKLLVHALHDPSEAVALAAAHALASHGRRDDVDAYLAENPGERADRIAGTLALLEPQARGTA